MLLAKGFDPDRGHQVAHQCIVAQLKNGLSPGCMATLRTTFPTASSTTAKCSKAHGGLRVRVAIVGAGKRTLPALKLLKIYPLRFASVSLDSP